LLLFELRNLSNNNATEATLHWLITQFIALQVICGEKLNEIYWDIAEMAAKADIKKNQDEIWSHGSLFELYLLKLIVEQSNIKTDESVKVTQNINETGNGKLITKHLEELVKLAKKIWNPLPSNPLKDK
jgi:hypothetical protein